jgi:hypothetical protein
MPQALVFLKSAVDADMRQAVALSGAPPQLTELLNPWNTHVAISGNTSKIRRVPALMERVADEWGLDIEVFIGNDPNATVLARGLVPNVFRNASAGFCTLKLSHGSGFNESADPTDPTLFPFGFRARGINGEIHAEGVCTQVGAKAAAQVFAKRFPTTGVELCTRNFDRVLGVVAG